MSFLLLPPLCFSLFQVLRVPFPKGKRGDIGGPSSFILIVGSYCHQFYFLRGRSTGRDGPELGPWRPNLQVARAGNAVSLEWCVCRSRGLDFFVYGRRSGSVES